jgi:hypothetical protein
MPTAPTSTWELAGNRLDALYPDEAEVDNIQLKPSTTYVRGTILGEITATPGVYGAYASGNGDGTQNPNHILQYSCVTDASGNITGIGEWGQAFPSVSAYMNGTFRTQELVGLDATAVTRLGARLIEGSVTQGIVRLP